MQELESRGLMNDTLIAYFSDNGIPYARGKTNMCNVILHWERPQC
jgi:arylsulfatase A-like enzyme